jgi:hypothetical protein
MDIQSRYPRIVYPLPSLCMADEGENIPRIVEQLRDEDHELDEAMNAIRLMMTRMCLKNG